MEVLFSLMLLTFLSGWLGGVVLLIAYSLKWKEKVPEILWSLLIFTVVWALLSLLIYYKFSNSLIGLIW